MTQSPASLRHQGLLDQHSIQAECLFCYPTWTYTSKALEQKYGKHSPGINLYNVTI